MPNVNLPDLPLIEPARGVSFACTWADASGSGSLELTPTHLAARRDGVRDEVAFGAVLGWHVDDDAVALRTARSTVRIRPPAELLSAVRAALRGRFGEQTDARRWSAR